jgi:hypothetical protein
VELQFEVGAMTDCKPGGTAGVERQSLVVSPDGLLLAEALCTWSGPIRGRLALWGTAAQSSLSGTELWRTATVVVHPGEQNGLADLRTTSVRWTAP